MSTIADNIKQVQENIAAACARAGRNPAEITLVAVSKRKPVVNVLDALAAGVQHFGENRVDEIESKVPEVAEQLGDRPEPVWHWVGHLQSRKTKDVLPLFPWMHSLDSVKLAGKMQRFAEDENLTPQVFIQVNVSGEQQKYGFDGSAWQTASAQKDALMDEFRQILAFDRLQVRGLMTMAPYGVPEADLRAVFQSLAALKAEAEQTLDVQWPDLSMGMTDDYPIAIEEGATIVRVGRAIFGEREYGK
ncbi:MAG: YggS family pyridoxal phosphate-dependent enzyme [Chloroflexota bacterium]